MKRKPVSYAITGLCMLIVLLAVYIIIHGVAPRTRKVSAQIDPRHTTSTVRAHSNTTSSAGNTLKTDKNKRPVAVVLPTNQKIAYLTFDDGPSENTPRLLKILEKEHVKASFFVVANSHNTVQARLWIGMEAAAGNTVGIHSFTHKYSYIYSSERNFLDDFDAMKAMIVQATGIEPIFCRFPGGTNNTVSLRYHNGIAIMPKLIADVQAQGITPVDWNAGAVDATIPVPDRQTIVNDVVEQCRYLKKAVILLHDSSPHLSSVEAVPEIVERLQEMGFVFEPLTQSVQAVTFKPAGSRTVKDFYKNTALVRK